MKCVKERGSSDTGSRGFMAVTEVQGGQLMGSPHSGSPQGSKASALLPMWLQNLDGGAFCPPVPPHQTRWAETSIPAHLLSFFLKLPLSQQGLPIGRLRLRTSTGIDNLHLLVGVLEGNTFFPLARHRVTTN